MGTKCTCDCSCGMPDKIMCDCGHLESDCSIITRGYSVYDDKTYCYPCSVEYVKNIMRETGKFTLYLAWDPQQVWARLIDWTGLLIIPVESIPVASIKVGKHNKTGKRYDVWFTFEGEKWHGVQYGDNTQLCYVNRLKS